MQHHTLFTTTTTKRFIHVEDFHQSNCRTLIIPINLYIHDPKPNSSCLVTSRIWFGVDMIEGGSFLCLAFLEIPILLELLAISLLPGFVDFARALRLYWFGGGYPDFTMRIMFLFRTLERDRQCGCGEGEGREEMKVQNSSQTHF